MRYYFINILVVTLIEGLMDLLEEGEKGMNRSRWQGMAPPISTASKGEEEKYTNKLLTIDFMRFVEMKKIINVLDYERSVLIVKL